MSPYLGIAVVKHTREESYVEKSKKNPSEKDWVCQQVSCTQPLLKDLSEVHSICLREGCCIHLL